MLLRLGKGQAHVRHARVCRISSLRLAPGHHQTLIKVLRLKRNGRRFVGLNDLLERVTEMTDCPRIYSQGILCYQMSGEVVSV